MIIMKIYVHIYINTAGRNGFYIRIVRMQRFFFPFKTPSMKSYLIINFKMQHLQNLSVLAFHMSRQKMAAMLIITETTALKLVYINILMFKNYTVYVRNS